MPPRKRPPADVVKNAALADAAEKGQLINGIPAKVLLKAARQTKKKKRVPHDQPTLTQPAPKTKEEKAAARAAAAAAAEKQAAKTKRKGRVNKKTVDESEESERTGEEDEEEEEEEEEDEDEDEDEDASDAVVCGQVAPAEELVVAKIRRPPVNFASTKRKAMEDKHEQGALSDDLFEPACLSAV